MKVKKLKWIREGSEGGPFAFSIKIPNHTFEHMDLTSITENPTFQAKMTKSSYLSFVLLH